VRKFKMEDSKAMVMTMSTTTALDVDEDGEHVDQREYRSMIESFLLTRNMHLAPSTQQAEQAGFTRAKNHKTCQSIFPEN
jgi:hypothetical protein